MSLHWKIILVVLVWISVFAWNKYVIQIMVSKVVRMNPKNNWLARKQEVVKTSFQAFFWMFYVLFTIAMLVSK